MNFDIVISGNLTGFSRFFASSEANEAIKESKIDLDYRNHLTFLNEGDKCYAISFSPRIVTVSLVTRILDSFRRPGVLVVSAIIPRRQKIVSDGGEQEAVFSVLNEVNDRFYQKNFRDGMINQNPAVLMQDYYSDIVAKYRLVSDPAQRAVNDRLDMDAIDKKSGYIAASERDMPKFLDSLFRKSYQGYHHVFFGEKAPQNIDETPEESITYRVRISNTNAVGRGRVPGEVRLSDYIPADVRPEQGEKDLENKKFTYQQILDGDAGRTIEGSIINGDTIRLTYNFPQEEKTIKFRFYEGDNKEIPSHLIRPQLVESDGTALQLSSEEWTFKGKEIYSVKTLKSGSSAYVIENGSQTIDPQRYRDGATVTVYVAESWEMLLKFPVGFDKPKKITLKHNGTPKDNKVYENVGKSIVEWLPGKSSEWDIRIESDYYETVEKPYDEFNVSKDLVKKTQVLSVSERSRQAGNRSRSVGGRNSGSRVLNETVVTDNRKELDATVRVADSGSNGRSKDQSNAREREKQLELEMQREREEQQEREDRKKRLISYGVYSVVAVLLVLAGVWAYKALFGSPEEEGKESKSVQFAFMGYDSQPITDASVLNLIELDFKPDSNIKVDKDTTDKTGFGIKISYPDTLTSHRVIVTARLKDAPDVQLSEDCYINIEGNPTEIKLNVNGEELNSIVQLKNGERPEKIETQIAELRSSLRKQDAFADVLASLSDQKNPTVAVDNSEETGKISEKVVKEEPKKQNVAQEMPGFPLTWDIASVKAQAKTDKYKNYQKEMNAISSALNYLQSYKWPQSIKGMPSYSQLPNNYRNQLQSIINLENRIRKLKNESPRNMIGKNFAKAVRTESKSFNTIANVSAKNVIPRQISNAEGAENQNSNAEGAEN